MSDIILYRAFIRDKKVYNRVYWGGSDDPETIKVFNEIKGKFPNEKLPIKAWIWGIEMESNVYSIHQCSFDADNKLSSDLQNSLLIDKDFIRYIYDMDTSTKSYEVFYKSNRVYPVQTLGKGLTVQHISDMANSEFVLQQTQAVYVTGTNANVWSWAESLKSGITMPISKSKTVADKDCFKFQFNKDKQLTEVTLCAHLERTMVYGKNDRLFTEYSCNYADEITNLDSTEIVQAKYDNHGNRVAQEVSKENINEYILVAKDDGSGGYDRVLLKDL